MPKTISIITPVFNEALSLVLFVAEVEKVFQNIPYHYQILFVNDGSSDNSQAIIEQLANERPNIKFLEFSRNFGKEIALSAGLAEAGGDALIMIDSDLQHPVDKIPEFIAKWEEGAEVVIGVRVHNQEKNIWRNVSSRIFYYILSRISDVQIVAQSTDFRLLDRSVANEFKRFGEHARITRGLIDWLGFKRDFVNFTAKSRAFGKPGYDKRKLLKLAITTFTAHSLFPLKFAGYAGLAIIMFSGPLGLFIFVSKYVLDDPLNLNFSGPAILAVINLFLIGIVLSSLGLIALYIGSIYGEVTNRPLYVVRGRKE